MTEIKQTTSSKIFYSTGDGSLSILEIDPHNNSFEETQSWDNLHEYKGTGEPASCCTFDVNGQEVITGKLFGFIYYVLNLLCYCSKFLQL